VARTTKIVSIEATSPRTSSTWRLIASRAVDGDQRLGVGELHALAHRLGREAAEDHVVRRADARAGEHRHDDLGDHRQEDPDHVAAPDPARLQRVGEALDVAVQVGVGDRPRLALLAVPVEGDALAAAGLDVTVDAVVGRVEPAAREPLEEGRLPIVEDFRPRLVPVQRLGLLGPPADGVGRSPVMLGPVG
jgi:hypothetical protein